MCTVENRTIVSLLYELSEQNVLGLLGPQGVVYLRPLLPGFGQITQGYVRLHKERKKINWLCNESLGD